MSRTILLVVVFGLAASACAGSESEPAGLETPERAVVAWFGAIDAGDTAAAAGSVHDDTVALILAIENDLDSETTAAYLADGVPIDVHEAYWSSFGEGFAAFASRPISTLTVGEASALTVEGVEYAVVPISSGPSAESVVFTRQYDDGSWGVDVVATLADGFASLLVDRYDELDGSEAAGTIRTAYVETVVPAMWAAMSDGGFGDDFNRIALTLVGVVDA